MPVLQDLGAARRRLGLLRIPEEAASPAKLARAVALYATLRQAEDGALAGVDRLRRDPCLLDAPRRMPPPDHRPLRDAVNVTLAVGLAKAAARSERLQPGVRAAGVDKPRHDHPIGPLTTDDQRA